MLLNLHVKNLAIIDEVEVDFSDNLNILTGETGAGKSIIIGSINIALGAKISKDVIRKGAEYALVELVFQLDDECLIQRIRSYDLPVEDGQVILSRKIMNGRSICKINGENVTAATLKEISSLLIDIHGQHEHQSLLYKSRHLDIVDHFAKERITQVVSQVKQNYREYSKLMKQLEDNVIDEDKRLREISFLEYEMNEIEEADLKEDEEEELEKLYKNLTNLDMITEGLSSVHTLAGEDDGMAGDCIGKAVKALSRLSGLNQELEVFYGQLSEIDCLVNEFNRNVSEYISSLEFQPDELYQIENRLNLIHRMKAKYGNSICEIQEYYQGCREKLEQYINYESYLHTLRQKKQDLEDLLRTSSEQLTKIRKEESIKLTKKIQEALIDLNFLEVNFQMKFTKMNHYSANGCDDAEFMISTNPGEELRPLSKVASGGELSRIMLAIKSVLADRDSIKTLIFDEIDVGISGRTAQKVSERLSYIAKNHQVLCITHLPQIAAMSDAHYVIEKQSAKSSTKTTIRPLAYGESVEELARILGGAKITEAIIASAREMKELAEHTKIC